MRHILRHGDHKPTINDLDLYQMGIDTKTNNLYIRTGNDDTSIIQLNDNSTLEQEEIRTWRFTSDKVDSGNDETPILKGMTNFPFDLSTDVRINAIHNGWDVTALEIHPIFSKEPDEYIPVDNIFECFTLNGDDMDASDRPSEDEEDEEIELIQSEAKAILPVNYSVNEWILTVSNTYSFKIGVYKTSSPEDGNKNALESCQSLIVVESLGLLSQGGIVL